jgi:hypothetical protein
MIYLNTFETFGNGKQHPYVYDKPHFIEAFKKMFEESGNSFICTYVASAIKMLEGDKVVIYGFSQKQNPTAKYFNDEDEDEDEGHHFAVYEDRFIPLDLYVLH